MCGTLGEILVTEKSGFVFSDAAAAADAAASAGGAGLAGGAGRAGGVGGAGRAGGFPPPTPCGIANDELVALLQAVATTIKNICGESVITTLNSKSCPATLHVTSRNGISEEQWGQFNIKSSLHSNVWILISKISLGVSYDWGATYTNVKKGNSASAMLLSQNFVDAQIAAQNYAIDNGKTFYNVPLPQLSNVDTITAAFGNPTEGKLKCVYDVIFSGAALAYETHDWTIGLFGENISRPCPNAGVEQIGLLQALATTIKSTCGESVTTTLNSKSCPPTLHVTSRNGISEKEWRQFQLKSSLDSNSLPGITDMTLGVSYDWGATYTNVKKGNSASAMLLSQNFVDAQIAAQNYAIDNGKTFYNVPLPQLSNVDTITAAFGNPTYGQLKCVYDVTFCAHCTPTSCCE